MKRFLALLLAFLLLFGAACSTGNSEEDKSSNDGSDSPDPASIDVAPETEGRPPCPVPEGTTFNGTEFRVMYRDSGYAYDITDAFAEELTGEIVNDAVYNRNLLMESTYGIKMVPIPEVSPSDTAQKDFISGSQGYDITIDCMTSAFPLALKQYFYDYNTLTYLNTADPWWDANISRDLTVAGHLFAMAGDISNRPVGDARFIYFSKGILEQYGLEYPYDYVREGTWTMDKMTEMVGQVSTDLDGDGKYTADDVLGLLKEQVPDFLTGCGIQYTALDEDGIPEIACIDERTITAMEKVHALFDLPNCTLSYDQASSGRDMSGYHHMWEFVRAAFFATNHFLFVQNGAGEAVTFRDMEPGYGVIPNPKLDESQQEYYHLVDPYTCAWFMPAAPVNAEFTDQIFTAWAYHSNDMREAYYEKTLKHKRMNAPEDSEMLDLIFTSLRYQVATICDLGIANVISNAYNTGNLASTYARSEKVINKKRQTIFKDLIENAG